MKKVLSIFLSLVMAMSLMVAPASAYFNDTVNHSNADAIEVLNTLGIVNGYSEDEFGPNDELTRAQICAIMVRAMTDDISKTYNDTFTDVPYNHPFRAEIDTAYHMGIMNGYGDGKFGPDDTVSYNSMLTIALNALGYNAKVMPGVWPENTQKYAEALGLTDGLTITDYSAACNRASACQIIFNMFEENLVSHDGLIFKESNTSFLSSIGFVEDINHSRFDDGYEYLTYQGANKYWNTEVKTSVDYEAVYVEGATAKVDKTEVNFAGAKCFLNGKATTWDKMGVKANDKLILTVATGADGKNELNKDTVLAVRFDTEIVKTYIPTKTPDSLIKDLKEYQYGISTITTVNDKIYVSNDYDFGYVMSVFTNADKDTCVKLSNGNTYSVSDMIAASGSQLSDVVENTYILIFMDYNGEAVGFRCV